MPLSATDFIAAPPPGASVLRDLGRARREWRFAGYDLQTGTGVAATCIVWRYCYINTMCQGRRLDVGGIYLIATNSSGPLIELASSDQTLLELSGAYPFDPGYLLRVSPTIEALLAALSGNGDFKLNNKETTLRMQRELPPPEVPPPEGMCLTLVSCDVLPPRPAPADR